MKWRMRTTRRERLIARVVDEYDKLQGDAKHDFMLKYFALAWLSSHERVRKDGR